MDPGRVPVHIECALRTEISNAEAKTMVEGVLNGSVCSFEDGPIALAEFPELSEHVVSIDVCDLGRGVSVSYWQARLEFHIFRIIEVAGQKDFLDSEDELPACEQWVLPCRALGSSLWDSVVLPADIKRQLLGYGTSSTLFADRGINSEIISWNRMILLYGPPGTGKTTLCKALAQKIFIRSDPGRFHSGVLLEVNAHSLFSKWFSESGKLVMKLFEHIEDLADDSSCMVTILIDEVESLVSSRDKMAADPGDATRSVNAMLTSLDALRHRSNIMLLCTSNLIGGIDEAFIDRLDLCIEIGLPCADARYEILRTCLLELMDKNIIVDPCDRTVFDKGRHGTCKEEVVYIKKLQEITDISEHLSGRMLRKIPLKGHALFLQRSPVTLWEYLLAMEKVVRRERDGLSDRNLYKVKGCSDTSKQDKDLNTASSSQMDEDNCDNQEAGDRIFCDGKIENDALPTS